MCLKEDWPAGLRKLRGQRKKNDIDILGRGAPGAWGHGLTSPPLPAPGAGKDEEVRGWALLGLIGAGGVLMGDGEGSDRGLVGAGRQLVVIVLLKTVLTVDPFVR